MPPLTLERAFGGLRKGEIAAAYCLSGPVDQLKDEFVDAVVERVLDPGTHDFNFDVRPAGDLDGESLHALIETPPMLADRRVVVVRGIEQWRKNAKVWDVLARYLEQPSPTTVLVLVHAGDGTPDARATRGTAHLRIGPLKPAHIARWVRRNAERAGLALEDDAVTHLIDAVGGDLGTLQQELAKLGAALPEDRPVTAADVGALVGVRRGETVPDWVSAVVQRDTVQAVRLLEVVLRQTSVTGVTLAMQLGTVLVGVRLARALADGGLSGRRLHDAVISHIKRSRPRLLRKWGDEATAWIDAAGRWSAGELDAAIAAVAEADRRLKSTTVSDERGVMTTLLLTLAEPRAA